MFSRATQSSTVDTTSSDQRFSLLHLRKLHSQLFENKNITEQNVNMVVEILRELAEMVVYGDNKSEILFDFFCEKNMLSLFCELMWNEGGCPPSVHIQILQTLSILINCVRNDTSLYYLLSNNYINEIIIYPHKFESDEGLLDQFVSFMKSVSLKLNKQTVQFFFNEETGSFPILTRAVELLGLTEQMVRISAQTTILNIYRVDDFRSREYALQDEVMHKLFDQMVKIMESQYFLMVKLCHDYGKESIEILEYGNGPNYKSSNLEHDIEDLMTSTEDWLYYIQDLMDLKILKLRGAWMNHLMSEFVYPVLLAPLETQYNPNDSESKPGDGAIPVDPSKGAVVENEGNSSQVGSQSNQTNPSDVFVNMESSEKLEPLIGSVTVESIDNSTSLICSLMYILQMLRIVNEPLLQRGLLLCLFHPLSRECRTAIMAELNRTEPLNPSNLLIDLDSIQWSRPRMAIDHILKSNNHANQAVVLLITYIKEMIYQNLLEQVKKAKSGNGQYDGDGGIKSDLDLLNHPTTNASNEGGKGLDEDESKPKEVNRLEEDITSELNVVELLHGLFMFHSFPIATLSEKDSASTDPLQNVSVILSTLSNEAEPQNHPVVESITHNDTTDGNVDQGQISPIGNIRNSTKVRKMWQEFSKKKKEKEYFQLTSLHPDACSLHLLNKIKEQLQQMIPAAHSTTPTTILSIESSLNHKESHTFFSDVGLHILNHSSQFSLTTLQFTCLFIFRSIKLTGKVFKSMMIPSHDPPDSMTSSLPTQCRDPLKYLVYMKKQFNQIRQHIGIKMLQYMDGTHSEIILNLIKEEMKRLLNVRSINTSKKMFRDITMMLPVSSITQQRLAIDFHLPISQKEIIRKDIQTFLMIRSIHQLLEEVWSTICNLFSSEETKPTLIPETIDDLVDEAGVAVEQSTLNTKKTDAHVQGQEVSASTNDDDELFSRIKDKDFLCLFECNLIPDLYALDTKFDMRGKRFLEAILLPASNAVSQANAQNMTNNKSSIGSPAVTTTQNGSNNVTGSILSMSSSLLGYGASNRRQSMGSSTPTSIDSSSTTTPSSRDRRSLNLPNTTNTPNASFIQQRVMFVQDPNYLILVTENSTTPSSFVVFLVSSLLYTDAKLIPENKKSFMILVRSWTEIPRMQKVNRFDADFHNAMPPPLESSSSYNRTQLKKGSFNSSHEASTTTMNSNNKFNNPKFYTKPNSDSLLKPREPFTFWQIRIVMETEQGCSLALQHIENRRQYLYNEKMAKLREIINEWSQCNTTNKGKFKDEEDQDESH